MNKSFSYLRTPKDLYNIKPNPEEAFEQIDGRRRRKLFYNFIYGEEELQQIQNFKQYGVSKGVQINCNVENICRYLHAYEFKFEDCLAKIREFLEWNADPEIQTISDRSRQILEEGFIYTYGRDKKQRPIIVMDMTKLDFQKYGMKDYYSAVNAVLNIVIEERFVKGVVETYLWMIDLGGENFTVSMDKVKTIVTKLSIVYSMLLGHMLIVNVGRFTKMIYNTAKRFIHPETVRKITLLDSKQKQEIKELIDEEEMFEKFGGKQPNVTVYWPPQVPRPLRSSYSVFYDMEKEGEDESVYYSIYNSKSQFNYDDQTIILEQSSISGMCCEKTDCSIF